MGFLLQCLLLGSWLATAQAFCAADNLNAVATLSPQASGYFRALAWIPSAQSGGHDLLLAGGEDQKLRVWELSGSGSGASGTLVNTLGGIHGTIWALQWSQAHSVLASGSGDGFIRLWPVSVLTTPQACHVEAKGNGNDLCCDGDGLGCEGRLVVSWRDANMSRAGQVHALEWMDGGLLASSWSDGVVRLWTYDAASAPPLAYRNSLSPTGRAYSLTWLTGPSQLAVVSPDWPLPELWDVDGTATPEKVLTKELPDGFGYCPTAHCGAVHASATNSGGDTLATGSEDQRVKLWTASDGAMAHDFVGQNATVSALAWMQSGDKLASGGSDGSLFMWDPTDTSSSSSLASITTAHSDRVSALVWAEELQVLASASYDLTVKLWDCAS